MTRMPHRTALSMCLALAATTLMHPTTGRAQPNEDNSPDSPAATAEKSIRILLKNAKFSQALEQLNTLPDSEVTPQIRFWRTWALASTGQLPAARRQADTIGNTAKAAAWRKQAQQVCRLATDCDRVIPTHAQAIVSAANQLSGSEVLSFRGAFQVDERTQLTGDFRLNLHTPDLNITMRRNQTAHLAIRFQNQTFQFVPGADASIHQYVPKQTIPRLQIALTKSDDDTGTKYNVMFGLGISSSNETFEPIQILKSPVIHTLEGTDEMLRYSLKRGSFPRKVQTDDTQRVLSWVTPLIDRPQWTETRVVLDGNDRFSAISLGQIAITKIQYGQLSEIREDNSVWQNRTVVEKGSLDPISMFQLIKTIMETLGELRKPASRIADRPQAVSS